MGDGRKRRKVRHWPADERAGGDPERHRRDTRREGSRARDEQHGRDERRESVRGRGDTGADEVPDTAGDGGGARRGGVLDGRDSRERDWGWCVYGSGRLSLSLSFWLAEMWGVWLFGMGALGFGVWVF